MLTKISQTIKNNPVMIGGLVIVVGNWLSNLSSFKKEDIAKSVGVLLITIIQRSQVSPVVK